MDSLEPLKNALNSVISTNDRHEIVLGLMIHFKQDTTGASKDSMAMSTSLQHMFGAKTIICSIPSGCGRGTMAHVLEALTALLPEYCDPKSALLICHYAGHGFLDSRGSLQFTAISRKATLDCNWLTMTLQNFMAPIDRSDIFFIVDSCHSGASVSRSLTERSFEVLYAAKASATTSGRGGKITFTQRILSIVRNFYKEGVESIDPLQILVRLKNDKLARTAGHGVIEGSKRLSLYFKYDNCTELKTDDSPAVAKVPDEDEISNAQVIVAIKMPEDPLHPSSITTIQHLRALATSAIKLEILSVDRSSSTVILIRGLAVYLCRLGGLKLDPVEWQEIYTSFCVLPVTYADSATPQRTLNPISQQETESQTSSETEEDSDDDASEVQAGSPPTSPMSQKL